MRVGVNAHLLPHGQTYRSAGVARYVQELMRRLPRVAPDNEYVFFVPRGTGGALARTSILPTWHPIVRIAWEQTMLPVEVRRAGLSVLHCPVNVSPLASTGPTVVTLHDLAFLRFPELFTAARAQYLRLVVGRSVRRARRVITPSESSRRDVVELLRVPEGNVVAVPLGVDERYTRRRDLPSPLREPYILYVGTIEPRKNLPLLLKAYGRLVQAGYPHSLALVGGKGWLYEKVDELLATQGLSERVVMPGFVEDLLPWYNSADLFVYPSVFEGFGLPPLEAMACGTPVVTSSAGALPEVVGDAGVVVPPDDEEALLNAMVEILEDPLVAARLEREGVARASLFSWDETARRTAEVYADAASETRPKC